MDVKAWMFLSGALTLLTIPVVLFAYKRHIDILLFNVYRRLRDPLCSIIKVRLFDYRGQSREGKSSPHELWQNLSEDMLALVANRLPLFDRIRFGSVCKDWQRVAKEKSNDAAPNPWMMLPQERQSQMSFFYLKQSRLSFFNLCNGTVHNFKLPWPLQSAFCCGSSKGWLIMAQEILQLETDLSYLIRSDPFMQELKWWPPAILCRYLIGKLEFWSDCFYINETRVILFNPASRVFLPLPLASTIPCYRAFTRYIDPVYNTSCFFHKIELSSADTSNCVVAALVNGSEVRRRVLAFSKPGDKRWSVMLADREELEYADILYHKGTLCALTLKGNNQVEDHILNLGETQVNVKLIPDLSRRKYYNPGPPEFLHGQEFLVRRDGHFHSYLVESAEGALLMIVKNANVLVDETAPDLEYLKTSSFAVFRVDDDTGQLTPLRSLDGEVIFLSYGGSFSLSAEDLPGFRGNCIFFSENHEYFHHYEDPIASRENGVYYLDSKTIQRHFPSVELPLQSRLSWFLPNSVNGKSKFN
ncbi:hypothetical protein Tsubulata_017386 [Turnera subulata]|uniref:DUF295 domain-containing protein n=1 Tax=Turnera subulata TaxID=218843 RepID=A0A9Q0JFA7_9ROSI|nr:hypothetical protein Tsubulata_017386 [Turnera subulata]